jgi:hypothetical protein
LITQIVEEPSNVAVIVRRFLDNETQVDATRKATWLLHLVFLFSESSKQFAGVEIDMSVHVKRNITKAASLLTPWIADRYDQLSQLALSSMVLQLVRRSSTTTSTFTKDVALTFFGSLLVNQVPKY